MVALDLPNLAMQGQGLLGLGHCDGDWAMALTVQPSWAIQTRTQSPVVASFGHAWALRPDSATLATAPTLDELSLVASPSNQSATDSSMDAESQAPTSRSHPLYLFYSLHWLCSMLANAGVVG